MQRVTLIDNLLDPASWKSICVDDVRPFLIERYPDWPPSARIYKGTRASIESDVTPVCQGDIEALSEYDQLTIVVFPGDPITIIAIVVAVVLSVALTFLLPSIPDLRNLQTGSSNNSLSERTNKVRPNGRIPDIFGQVRSVPDLIAVPYRVYEDHRELEISFMCIGRGRYLVEEIRDGDTLVADIDGASVAVYGPETSPNLGMPEIQIGTAISDPLFNAVRLNEVNGQVLRAPNDVAVRADEEIIFADGGIVAVAGPDIDFTEYFAPGMEIEIGKAVAGELDLGGTYVIDTVTAGEITLVNPQLINADWSQLALLEYGETDPLSSFVSTETDASVGPYIVEASDTDLVVANFVALQGLFKDNGKKQIAFPIEIELELTPVDQNDDPTGPAETFSVTLEGNAKGRDMRAATLVAEPTFTGRMQAVARRVTPSDLEYEGTVVDEVKWKDLYGITPVSETHFGNVTTVHSRNYATESATSSKERKINMLVTRKVPERISGSTFGPEAATLYAPDIFVAICLDAQIGGRTLDELDLDSIYGAAEDAVAYFGQDDAAQFCYTFDDDNLSFEETASIVASAIFSTAYRQGQEIKLSFERATEDSGLIFNHRNKVPGSEKRTVRFGNLDEHDGVELEYVAPEDDAPVTIYIPPDRSATNPRQIKTVGVRSHEQAYWIAWRAWNKIRYQNVATEFSALQEAATVIRNDRVIVADNTRPDTQDGEVIDQVGLELELSQPVDMDDGYFAYSIFLQLPDGTVESIPASEGSDEYHVVLLRAPRVDLALDDDLYARATYHLVRDITPRETAFLVAEKDPEDNSTFGIKAVNYSPLYYINDQLELWLTFDDAYLDASPYLIDGIPEGASAIEEDVTRGFVHGGGAAADRIDLPAGTAPLSYSKTFWARRDSLSGGGSILSSTSTHERIAFSAFGVTASHNAGVDAITASWPGGVGEWHFVAVTFDATDLEAAIYIDGELVASDDMPLRTRDDLHAVGYNGADGFAGAIDDLRLMHRALVASEILALYRSTRGALSGEAPSTLEFLATEDGDEMRTEDNDQMIEG